MFGKDIVLSDRLFTVLEQSGRRRKFAVEKKPFVTKEQLDKIVEKYPTPFHLYDEKGIRQTARDLYKAFSWNEGFKEYFAVKATPTPAILKILQEEGCGTDCSSLTELMMDLLMVIPLCSHLMKHRQKNLSLQRS